MSIGFVVRRGVFWFKFGGDHIVDMSHDYHHSTLDYLGTAANEYHH